MMHFISAGARGHGGPRQVGCTEPRATNKQVGRLRPTFIPLALNSCLHEVTEVLFVSGRDSWGRTRGNVGVTSPLPERLLTCSIISRKVACLRQIKGTLYFSGIKEPFLRPELADRLAAMLDAVLEQLTNGWYLLCMLLKTQLLNDYYFYSRPQVPQLEGEEP